MGEGDGMPERHGVSAAFSVIIRRGKVNDNDGYRYSEKRAII